MSLMRPRPLRQRARRAISRRVSGIEAQLRKLRLPAGIILEKNERRLLWSPSSLPNSGQKRSLFKGIADPSLELWGVVAVPGTELRDFFYFLPQDPVNRDAVNRKVFEAVHRLQVLKEQTAAERIAMRKRVRKPGTVGGSQATPEAVDHMLEVKLVQRSQSARQGPDYEKLYFKFLDCELKDSEHTDYLYNEAAILCSEMDLRLTTTLTGLKKNNRIVDADRLGKLSDFLQKRALERRDELLTEYLQRIGSKRSIPHLLQALQLYGLIGIDAVALSGPFASAASAAIRLFCRKIQNKLREQDGTLRKMRSQLHGRPRTKLTGFNLFYAENRCDRLTPEEVWKLADKQGLSLDQILGQRKAQRVQKYEIDQKELYGRKYKQTRTLETAYHNKKKIPGLRDSPKRMLDLRLDKAKRAARNGGWLVQANGPKADSSRDIALDNNANAPIVKA